MKVTKLNLQLQAFLIGFARGHFLCLLLLLFFFEAIRHNS